MSNAPRFAPKPAWLKVRAPGGETYGNLKQTFRATLLFRAVRERFRYDPYSFSPDPSALKASSVLAHDRAWCVPKAVVLCAAARAVGIPARLGFADVRNHLASEKHIFTDLEAAIAHARLHAATSEHGPAACPPAGKAA